MFELFGCFSLKADDAAAEGAGDGTAPPIVHTRSLTDGEAGSKASAWRSRYLEVGVNRYLEQLAEEVERTQRARLHQIRQRWPGIPLKMFNEVADRHHLCES